MVDIFDVEKVEVFFRIQCNDCEKFRGRVVAEEQVIAAMEHCWLPTGSGYQIQLLEASQYAEWVYR